METRTQQDRGSLGGSLATLRSLAVILGSSLESGEANPTAGPISAQCSSARYLHHMDCKATAVPNGEKQRADVSSTLLPRAAGAVDCPNRRMCYHGFGEQDCMRQSGTDLSVIAETGKPDPLTGTAQHWSDFAGLYEWNVDFHQLIRRYLWVDVHRMLKESPAQRLPIADEPMRDKT